MSSGVKSFRALNAEFRSLDSIPGTMGRRHWWGGRWVEQSRVVVQLDTSRRSFFLWCEEWTGELGKEK